MSVTIGSKAPAFTLVNTEKQKVSLEDFKGQNLVILFFPMAFTSVCTAELCSIRDNISTYNGLNTAVVGISVDSPFTLGKFKEEQKLNFPLLSDFNKEASQAYGAFYENFVLDLKGVSKRAAFVVDKEGIIRYAQVLESAGDLPDFEAVKKTLAGL
ncbi:redoxin domain-containing protein [Chitinophaga oryziterrae]|uniref:Redoxin domain-containing protein n=1 Tax=Chitinophaga oryziterrae TaxID=1031224 RepID=A0A6N8J4Z7_9BACT|nr:peroxiredoxin [Chitinophaga oryziterrae]MVT39346.1 redoxin domain-containing protein [Chitinophaga oryziterrae]